jgi:putative aldouronate transport system permease protein
MSQNNNILKRLRCWRLYILLLPAIVYFVVFYYAPMYGLQIAFKDYSPVLGIMGSPWAGLKYFKRFISMPQFYTVFFNTLSLSLYSLLFNFPMPIILALFLNECQNVRYKKLVQNITYAPYFVSTIVIVGMMIQFLSPSMGVINKVIEMAGGTTTEFMAKSEWFKPLYIISTMWQRTGWASVVYLAALASIDVELHEAAAIDGAGKFSRIIHINIPSILPTVITMFILNCGQIMSVGFEKAYLMQNSLNLNKSEIISTYIYKVGLLGAQFSFTAAVGVFNSLLNFFIILAANEICKRISDTSLF